MRPYLGWFLGAVWLALVAGPALAGTEFSGGGRELKVVITADRTELEQEASELLKAGETDAALKIYRELIEESGADTSLSAQEKLELRLRYLGMIVSCYQQRTDYQRALEEYREMLQLAEQQGWQRQATLVLRGMGRAALAGGLCHQVIPSFEQRRAHLVDKLLVLLGDMYNQVGRGTEARGLYQEVLDSHLGPQLEGRRLPGCYGLLPQQRQALEEQILEKRADLVSALEELAGEGSPEALLILGERAWGQRQWSEALGWFQKAEQALPDDPMIGLQVARTLIALDRQQEALEKLAEIRSSLKSPGELLEISTALELAGEPQGARRVLQALASQFPQTPEAAEAWLRLGLMQRLGL